MVTSEAVPFSKSGGLADVAGSLSCALTAEGHDVRLVLPAIGMTLKEAGAPVCTFEISLLSSKEKVSIRTRTVNGTRYFFVCHSSFNERKGIYGDTSFTPYPDNFVRFTILSKAALMYCMKVSFSPDIIQCNDWTTGLIPYYMKELNSPFFKDTRTVMTVHNLGYQGTFERMEFLLSSDHPNEALFHDGKLNMLRSGLVFSDCITTVSPTYAKEMMTKEQGFGLDELISSRASVVSGIVNGIDVKEWDPQTDEYLDEHFSIDDLSPKAVLKAQVQKEFGLPVAKDVPLFAMISRLASQKGFETLLTCLEDIARSQRLQFVIIGTGDSALERGLLDIASRNDNVSVNILFNVKASHLVEAGSDFFLMPSKYEPCGLNQIYSLRYGTIPVARRTGGLADTIIDVTEHPGEGTGILFDELSADAITRSVRRAVELYSRPGFDSVRKRAMARDCSWNSSAKEYLKVFESLIK